MALLKSSICMTNTISYRRPIDAMKARVACNISSSNFLEDIQIVSNLAGVYLVPEQEISISGNECIYPSG